MFWNFSLQSTTELTIYHSVLHCCFKRCLSISSVFSQRALPTQGRAVLTRSVQLFHGLYPCLTRDYGLTSSHDHRLYFVLLSPSLYWDKTLPNVNPKIRLIKKSSQAGLALLLAWTTDHGVRMTASNFPGALMKFWGVGGGLSIKLIFHPVGVGILLAPSCFML